MENLFKVGDKLEITGGMWFSKGDIVKIKDVDEDDPDRTYRCTNGRNTWWVENENVKPVQPKVKGFKAGDRIEMINNDCNARVGMKGTIISEEVYLSFGVCFDDKDTAGFHTCNGRCENGRGHYIQVSNMKLISAVALKVGDRVKVLPYETIRRVKDTYHAGVVSDMEQYCGKVYPIKEFLDEGYHKFVLDGAGRWSWTDEFCIPYMEKPKFSVGQVYKVGCSGWGDNAVIKITDVKGKHAKYKMLKGKNDFGMSVGFDFDSIFGKSLTLLTDAEIGEALKEDKPAVKEVKRAAKIGEYIKIVDISEVHKGYEYGDIIEVKSAYPNGVFGKSTGGILNREYVVLEGYQPDTVREVKRAAKVGEYVKTISGNGGFIYADTVYQVDSINGDKSLEVKDPSGQYDCCNLISSGNYVVLENYKPSAPEKPSIHHWTPAEVEKAKTLVLNTIRDYAEKDEQIIINHDSENEDDNSRFSAIIIHHDTNLQRVGNRYSFTSNRATSKCSDTDEPNEWIGKAVALCKLLHKPIPAFIMGEKTLKFSFEKAKAKAHNDRRERVAIHCKNEIETHELSKVLDSLGYKWSSGSKLTELFYGDDIYYFVYDDKDVAQGKNSEGEKFVEFSDCFTEE